MNCKFLKLLVLFDLYNISMCALAQTDDTINKDTLAFESIATLDSTKLNYDNFMVIPGSGLFVKENDSGEFRALDRKQCPEFEHLKFLDNLWYDQVVTSANRTYVRNSTQIYDIGKDKCSLVAELDTASFRLFAANDSSFLFVVYQNEGSLLYRYNLTTDNTELLYATTADIYGAELLNDAVWFVAGNSLYETNENGTEEIFVYEPEDLIGMTLTQRGALVYTATKVILFDGENAIPVASGSFFRIIYSSGRTYFVLRDGNVLATDAL